MQIAAAIITPGEDFIYAFLREQNSGSEPDISAGAWCFPTCPIHTGDEGHKALYELLIEHYYLDCSITKSLSPCGFGQDIYFPYICALQESRGLQLEGFAAIKLDRAENLMSLHFEKPFDLMLEEFCLSV
ncbi:MAG: hypothetical protein LBC99_07710 [Spirochaetota bacterium]|jgi:hypothetical protein|nr:hypothetical protein [Spirochaetota bacterium]